MRKSSELARRRKHALHESKRGFSIATGSRLIAAGKIKVTQLSPHRIGIREHHAREYLDACLRRVS